MNTNDPNLRFYDVDNAVGDRCTVPIITKPGRPPQRYHGLAVIRAKQVLPDRPPFKVINSYKL
jgi:hypothetical protein